MTTTKKAINHDGIVDDVIVLEDAMAAIGQGEFESAYHIVRHLVENKKREITRRRNTDVSIHVKRMRELNANT